MRSLEMLQYLIIDKNIQYGNMKNTYEKVLKKYKSILPLTNNFKLMQSVYFEGASEIKKPSDMTDEKCMSAFETPIADKPVRLNTSCRVRGYRSHKRRKCRWVQLHCGPRLIPMASITLDENN